MVEKHTCDYGGEEIEPDTDAMYVRTDDTALHFKDSKAEKNYFLGRGARDLEWTEAGHHAGGRAGDSWISDAERTFVMIKPNGVQYGLIGDIASRFGDHGLKMVAGKFMQIDEELAHDRYGEHKDRPFLEGLVDFITSGPVFAMVWEGQDATRQVRCMVGETDPAESAPGTIRGSYNFDLGRSVIHGSGHENEGANEHEIALLLDEDESADYECVDET